MDLILDFFRTTFESEFQTAMTGDRIAIGLLVSFFLSLYILFVYRTTYQGVAQSPSFAFSLVLLSMVTSMVIMTVTTNLALSLGMVGALSIVRFRTAVKDPSDTVFMFWAIAMGIMAGAGLVYVTVITNLALGLLYLLYFFLSQKMHASPYLLVIRYEASSAAEVEDALASLRNLSVKSKVATSDYVELCLKTRYSKEMMRLVDEVKKLPGVKDVSAVSLGAETSL